MVDETPAADGLARRAIPRIIHQTYATAELPALLQENVAELRRDNPGWEYRFYDDAAVERFIGEEFGQDALGAYESINPRYGAARADLFRYLLIFRHGGVYLDIKSSVDGSLDDRIHEDDVYLVSQWRCGRDEPHFGWGRHWELRHIPRGEYQQWFIAAAPGHPFLKAVIDRVMTNLGRYCPRTHGVGRRAVLRMTGPVAYTLAIEPLLGDHPHRRVADESCLGLRYSILPGTTHRQLFARHYEAERQPLVGPPLRLAEALHVQALETARNLRDRIRNRLPQARR